MQRAENIPKIIQSDLFSVLSPFKKKNSAMEKKNSNVVYALASCEYNRWNGENANTAAAMIPAFRSYISFPIR